VRDVSSAVADVHQRLFGQPLEGTIQSWSKPGATIVRVVSPRHGSYYVKAKRTQPALNPDPARVKQGVAHEHAALAALAGAAGAELALPRPLYMDAEAALLVTSEVPGQRLSARYGMAGRALAVALVDDFVRIGRALRRLHDAELPPGGPGPMDILQDFDRHLDHAALDLPRRMRARLRRLAFGLDAEQPSPAVTCHNDLTLDNVLVDDRCVSLVDLDAVHRNRPEWDFASLFASVHEFLCLVPRRHRRLDALWAAFVAGYGEPIDRSRLRPFLIRHLVHHLIDLGVRWRQTHGLRRQAHLVRVRAVNRSLLCCLLGEAEASVAGDRAVASS
jgi:aminoglycoside phosphotransferase